VRIASLEQAIRNNFDYVAAIRQLQPPVAVNSSLRRPENFPGIYDTTKKPE